VSAKTGSPETGPSCVYGNGHRYTSGRRHIGWQIFGQKRISGVRVASEVYITGALSRSCFQIDADVLVRAILRDVVRFFAMCGDDLVSAHRWHTRRW